MNAASASSLPWSARDDGHGGVLIEPTGSPPGRYLAFLPFGKTGAKRGMSPSYYGQETVLANADLIVRACNLHAELVSELEEGCDAIANLPDSELRREYDNGQTLFDVLQRMRATLAKAQAVLKEAT